MWCSGLFNQSFNALVLFIVVVSIAKVVKPHCHELNFCEFHVIMSLIKDKKHYHSGTLKRLDIKMDFVYKMQSRTWLCEVFLP